MKKTIAHIHQIHSPNDHNEVHHYAIYLARFDSIILCEDIDSEPMENSWRIHSFSDKNKFLSRLNKSRCKKAFGRLYRVCRNNFYKSVILKNRVSLIHAHFGSVGAEVSGLAKELNLPMVVTFYGYDISGLIRERRWIKLYQGMFGLNCRFIVLCEEAKRRLEAIGCPSSKIRIADCLNDLKPYAYKERYPSQGIKLLTAARFVEKKGYPVLFEAISKLVKSGHGIELTAIGYGSAEQKRSIAKEIARLGLSEKVSIIDTSDKGIDFIKVFKENLDTHDIFVLPSIAAKNGDDEGGPSLTLVNAQSAGMPIVTTRFPGSERSVIDNETGIFCEMNDSSSLAEKISYLIKNPDLWNVLGRRASDFVNENLSVEKEIMRIIDIYGEML